MKVSSILLIIVGLRLFVYDKLLFWILMFTGIFLLGTIGLREFMFSAI